MIILVTDGGYNEYQAAMIPSISARFQAENIACYGILLRERAVPVAEEAFYRDTGGGHFIVESTVEDTSLEAIFKRIDAMKKVKMKVNEPLAVNRFQPVIIPGLAALLLHILALLGLRFTPW